jgi:hypothetical protein
MKTLLSDNVRVSSAKEADRTYFGIADVEVVVEVPAMFARVAEKRVYAGAARSMGVSFATVARAVSRPSSSTSWTSSRSERSAARASPSQEAIA